MASTFSEVDEIRRHMAQIRHELHEDVQGVVRGAEATADWRRYIRNYPWAAIGLAFGVGYLIVPRRPRPQMPAFPYMAQQAPQAAAVATAPPVPAPAEPAKKKGKGIFRTVLGLVAPIALRTAQGYALQFFEQFLAQKMAQQQSPFTDLAASFMNQGQPASDGADPMTNLRYPARG